MSFDALLNTTCTIQEKSVTQDAAGQMIKSWADELTDVPCRIDATGGGEVRSSTAVYENTTHVLFMRNPSTITLSIGNYRIVSGGDTYTILLVQKMYGFSDLEHLEVLLEIVK